MAAGKFVVHPYTRPSVVAAKESLGSLLNTAAKQGDVVEGWVKDVAKGSTNSDLCAEAR